MVAIVWGYKDHEFKILEITQYTITDQLFKYMQDSDFGDTRECDIKINKPGTSGRVRYIVIAAPPKPLLNAAATALETL